MNRQMSKQQTVNLKVALICLYFGAGLLNAQNTQADTNATYVIASGGLNLRTAPSVSSKKITTIPFGSRVKYLSAQSFNKDSISVPPEREITGGVIYGHWVKVQYKNTKGYVFDAYLNRPPRDLSEGFDEKYSEEFILLYPGCGCTVENLRNPNGWKWFGYFRNGEGEYKVEAVDISYYKMGIPICEFVVAASKHDSLEFIIGTKNGKMPGKKTVRGRKLQLYYYGHDTPIKQSDLDKMSIEVVKNKDTKVWKPDELYLVDGKRKQLLNKASFDHPTKIIFAGDLDGDSKDDYIISYGDKTGIIILYLTSRAKPKNLIERVAVYFGFYCC